MVFARLILVPRKRLSSTCRGMPTWAAGRWRGCRSCSKSSSVKPLMMIASHVIQVQEGAHQRGQQLRFCKLWSNTGHTCVLQLDESFIQPRAGFWWFLGSRLSLETRLCQKVCKSKLTYPFNMIKLSHSLAVGLWTDRSDPTNQLKPNLASSNCAINFTH